MDTHQDLLEAFAVVLAVAGVTSVLSARFKLPVVLGYLASGLVIGPHVGIPLVADPAIVHTLSELGVILLMFSLGLEFSLRRLIRVGPAALITAILQSSLLFWLGFAVSRALGWTALEGLFAGSVLAISSTTIIAKAFAENKVGRRVQELVIGVLIVEDLIAIVLMTTLSTVASGAHLTGVEIGRMAVKLVAFLVGLLVLGMLVVPRVARRITALRRPEVTIITAIGLCFVVALMARGLGYSVALGAFLAGSLLAESGEEHVLAPLVEPVRDLFGAVFFVSVGMMIEPALLVEHASTIALFTATVVIGKIGAVTLGAFLTGNGVRTSIESGMSLAQIGEFSFIIAGLGLSLGATRPFLYPIAVAVSAVTTLLTPWLIRAAPGVARTLDRKMPSSMQTFVSVYGSWLERLNAARSASASQGTELHRLVRRLVVDGVALGAIVIGGALGASPAADALVQRSSMSPHTAASIVAIVLALLAAPFCVGIVRVGVRLARVLASLALPETTSGVDLAAAARRTLRWTLSIGILLLVALPLLAITQPFLPGIPGAPLLLALLLLVVAIAGASAHDFEGHVRAAAQVLVELLAKQSHTSDAEVHTTPAPLVPALEGIGNPVRVDVAQASPACGKTLSELDFRGTTGATVLVITRTTGAVVLPTAEDRLEAGDVLAVAGSAEALEAARSLVESQPSSR